MLVHVRGRCAQVGGKRVGRRPRRRPRSKKDTRESDNFMMIRCQIVNLGWKVMSFGQGAVRCGGGELPNVRLRAHSSKTNVWPYIYIYIKKERERERERERKRDRIWASSICGLTQKQNIVYPKSHGHFSTSFLVNTVPYPKPATYDS